MKRSLSNLQLWNLLGKRCSTVKTCYQILKGIDCPQVLELGTIRSFRSEIIDTSFYQENPDDWDWGAGCFTAVISYLLPHCSLTSVDSDSTSIDVSRRMTAMLKSDICYIQAESSDFLMATDNRFDLIYMDHGEARSDDTCAILHRQDAEIIFTRNLVTKDGLILVDDVRERFGKGMYSIPFLRQCGYSQISHCSYQTLLRRESGE